MITRHKKKAYVGIGLWITSLVIMLLLCASHPRDQVLRGIWVTSILLDILAIFAFYFWAGHHLAIARGYSPALALYGIFGPPAQLILFVALFSMADRYAEQRHSGRSKSRSQSSISNTERIVICRRNAVVGIFFGILAVAIGILLVKFRWGIFADHQNEVVLGMFVFLFGYCGVNVGCWYWLKAKNWPDVLMIVGLLPAAIFFVPFVRLLVLANPQILIAGMVMMPLILTVTIMVLPDKSGWAGRKRKRWRLRG